jgi:hypothetical protein
MGPTADRPYLTGLASGTSLARPCSPLVLVTHDHSLAWLRGVSERFSDRGLPAVRVEHRRDAALRAAVMSRSLSELVDLRGLP